MSDTVIKRDGSLKLVRSALGQVIEYDVYRGAAYVGGGSKREAHKLFAEEVAVRDAEVDA